MPPAAGPTRLPAPVRREPSSSLSRPPTAAPPRGRHDAGSEATAGARGFTLGSNAVIMELGFGLGGPGAVERRAFTELDVLARDGHRAIAITDVVRGELPPGVEARGTRRAALVRLLPHPGWEIGGIASVERVLRSATASIKPDVIVYHSSTLAWTALPAAQRTGARSVFVVHALISDKLETDANPYGPVTTALYKYSNDRALRGSDRIVCVSRHIAAAAEAAGAAAEKIRVLHNPIEADRFASAPPAERDIDLLYVGRLSWEKGVDVLLEAVSGLPPSTRLVVAGEGRLRRSLESSAREIDCEVEFAGWVDREQLPRLMARARLLVLPSRTEAHPMVALEALAAGLPVVASNVGGVAETVRDGVNGWLVPSERPDLLRAAMVDALADPARLESLRSAARESAQEFSLEAFAQSLEGVYVS